MMFTVGLREEAEKAAAETLSQVWDPTFIPVDPIEIAGSIGIQVFVTELKTGVSGAISIKPGGRASIYLARGDSLNRQRFTAAHEIGHYRRRELLGKLAEAHEVWEVRGPLAATGQDADEIFANSFAAALLMPRAVVVSRRAQGESALDLSYAMEVSAEAMGYRLRNLGV